MKQGRIVKRQRALEDLEERSDYIWADSPRAALRFLDEAQAAFQRLAGMPGLGNSYKHSHPALAGLRVTPLGSLFNAYLVFYLPLADGIEVLRVLHGARDIDFILAGELGSDDDVQPRPEQE